MLGCHSLKFHYPMKLKFGTKQLLLVSVSGQFIGHPESLTLLVNVYGIQDICVFQVYFYFYSFSSMGKKNHNHFNPKKTDLQANVI